MYTKSSGILYIKYRVTFVTNQIYTLFGCKNKNNFKHKRVHK